MTEQNLDKNLTKVQFAADRVTNPKSEEQSDALEKLAHSVLEHFNHECNSTATAELFSRELPVSIQRFASVWLVRCLIRSPNVLGFGDTQRLAATLFDRAFQNDVYGQIKIEPGIQTFEKLQALTAHFQRVFAKGDELVNVTPDLAGSVCFREK